MYGNRGVGRQGANSMFTELNSSSHDRCLEGGGIASENLEEWMQHVAQTMHRDARGCTRMPTGCARMRSICVGMHKRVQGCTILHNVAHRCTTVRKDARECIQGATGVHRRAQWCRRHPRAHKDANMHKCTHKRACAQVLV